MPFHRPSLNINCGFARASVYCNSDTDTVGAHARESIDTLKRAREFRTQFSNFSYPENYFQVGGKDRKAPFDRDCDKILDGFKSKFLAGARGDRQGYLETFSLAKWHALPVVERNKHTMSNCVLCCEQYYDRQRSFPLKPMYCHNPTVTVQQGALQRQGTKKFTNNLLEELNQVYKEEAGTSFADAVVASTCAHNYKLSPLYDTALRCTWIHACCLGSSLDHETFYPFPALSFHV